MQYRVGQITEGTITGIQPYGAFVSLDDETAGLIHISEISDGFVRDVGHFVHLQDRVRVKIIDYDRQTHQARLSLKALHSTSFRKERGRGKTDRLPVMKIGFRSLEEKLDSWIREANKGEKL